MDEPGNEGVKRTTIEMPDFWFDAIYEGNAIFPQSNAGIATLLLADLFTARTPPRDIHALITPAWRFSERHKEILTKAINTMHARYAVPVAGHGDAAEFAEDLKEQHGAAAKPVREMDEDRFESFAEDTIEIAHGLFNSLLLAVRSGSKEYPEQHFAIVGQYVVHAATLLRSDPEIQALLMTHKELLRDHQLLPEGSGYNVRSNSYSRVLDVRKIISAHMISKTNELMKNSTALAVYPEEARAAIMKSVSTRYDMMLSLGQ